MPRLKNLSHIHFMSMAASGLAKGTTNHHHDHYAVSGYLAGFQYCAYSFIHSRYSYSTPSRNLLRGTLSPATDKEKCLKEIAERRHIVPGQQAQRKREFI